jgi:Ca2+-binding EF-hand superfamily protein
VLLAFDVLDKDKSGTVTADEIADTYDASRHPDVISGKSTERKILLEFLDCFEIGGEKDGIVSSSIDIQDIN